MFKAIDDLLEIFESTETKAILKESELCFKIGANRAALLFAFSSLMNALKNRILQAGKPSAISDGEWNALVSELMNDDEMEKSVLKCIQSQSNKYFDISSTLKREVDYWKDRRNACAHWKSENIDSQLVANFYSFILFNQFKFSLKSNIEYSISEIYSVFDPTKYRPGTPIDPKIQNLQRTLSLSDLPDFYKTIRSNEYFPKKDCKLTKITDSILRVLPKEFIDPLIDLIRLDVEWLSVLLEENIKWIGVIIRNDAELKVLLSQSTTSDYRQSLFSSIISSGRASTEIAESFYKTTLYSTKEYIIDNYKEIILNDSFYNWFISELKSDKIKSNKFLWINERADILHQLFTIKEPDAYICGVLSELFSKTECSWWLLERFERKEQKSKDFNTALVTVATRENIVIPEKLSKAIQKSVG